ncbi:MAG: hypothetical protein ACLPIG_15100 [Methylocella sp.]
MIAPTQLSIAEHINSLLAAVRARLVPGTHLIRYGEGDCNDSLQPVDPRMRDWMLSSWTVAMPLLPTVMPQVPIRGGSNPLTLASKEAGGSIPAAPASSPAFWSIIFLGTGGFGASLSYSRCCQLPFKTW